MKLRLLAGLAAAALGLTALPSAHAGLPPQITDATGDAKGAQAGFDIVSVTFDTTKSVSYKLVKVGKKKKKKVAVYTPTHFTVTMTTAGPVKVDPGTSYQIIATDSACGQFYAFAYFSALDAGPGTSMQFGNCGEVTARGDSFLVEGFTFTSSGNSLTFSAPLKTLPPQVKVNTTFSGLYAYTAPAEPVVGYAGPDFAPTAETAEATTFDYAASTKTYKFGS